MNLANGLLCSDCDWPSPTGVVFQTIAAFTLAAFTLAAFTLPQKLARLNRAGLGPDLAHFSGTVYIATKTSSVDPSPVRGARLYVLPFYSFLVE